MITFKIIGMMCCVFAVSALLNNIRISLNDSNSHQNLQNFLSIICGILWLASAPVSIAAFILHLPFSKRLQHAQDRITNQEYIIDSNNRIQHELESEITSLKFLLEAERQREPEQEFRKGIRNGYIPGYRQGFSDALSHSQLPSSEVESLKHNAKDRSVSLSNEYMKKHFQ